MQVLIRRGYSHYQRGDTDPVLREGMKQVPGENPGRLGGIEPAISCDVISLYLLNTPARA
jgi:hypothetical protein